MSANVARNQPGEEHVGRPARRDSREEDKKPNVEATETPARARGSRLTAERLREKRKESIQ